MTRKAMRRRQFRPAPSWMRDGRSEVIFDGALGCIGSVSHFVADYTRSTKYRPEPSPEEFRHALVDSQGYLLHEADLAIDALDVVIRRGYRVDEAEVLLERVGRVRSALIAHDAEALVAGLAGSRS